MNEPPHQRDDTPRLSPVRPPKPIRVLLGLRERLVIDGVRYRELSPESLRRALSRRGLGHKDYAVRFPAGRRMRIHVTSWRSYEDLTGPVLLRLYERVGTMIRPGSRVLALRAGTGYAAAWLARRVGPSGAIVSIDDDEESVRYARWRYPADNIAFELSRQAPHDDLRGETDGAFQAALLVHAVRASDDAEAMLAECMRVVEPGGFVYLASPRRVADEARAAGDPCDPMPMTRESMSDLIARAHGRVGSEPYTIQWRGESEDPHVAAEIRLGAPETGGRARGADLEEGPA